MDNALTIDVQPTPNPNATKFTLNRVIAAQGKTYRDAASADAEWAKRLLGVSGVIQAFAVNNFISVTKAPDAQWESVVPQVQSILKQAFA